VRSTWRHPPVARDTLARSAAGAVVELFGQFAQSIRRSVQRLRGILP
jgi:hypothetical protein